MSRNSKKNLIHESKLIIYFKTFKITCESILTNRADMARPKKIDDELILKAAHQLFIELGPSATTAMIAEHAGVSEGLLFKRFGSKHDLFLASMGLEMPEWFSEISADFDGAVEDRLVELATRMVALMRRVLPKVEIIFGQDPGHRFSEDSPPVVAVQQLDDFFSNLEPHGYRAEHPQVLARAFMGSLHHFVFSSLKGIDEFCPCSEELYIKQIVSMIVGSMHTVKKGKK